MSNFSISHSIFKRLVLQTHKKQGLFGKGLNFFPSDNISDSSKLKAFADDKINVTQNFKFDLGQVESFEGKGENAGYKHFLLFPHKELFHQGR